MTRLYLPLFFSSVLQYYAKQTNTTVKDYYPTERHPTKNAVVGMIGAALGCPRGDQRLSELTDNLDVLYRRTRGEATIYVDFQIVGLKDTDAIRLNGGAVQQNLAKRVEYIQDTDFAVYIGAEDENLLKEIYTALRNPVFAPYFGKRICVPNAPIARNFTLYTEEELQDAKDGFEQPLYPC